MKIGLYERFTGSDDRGVKFLAEVAELAERNGIHQLWYPEHPVYFPEYGTDKYPYVEGESVSSRTGVIDAFAALAYVAARTSRIRLGTFVTVIAERHPLLTARAVAAVDVLSDGRFDLGVGVGWSTQEYEAFGVPFGRRGARTDEYIRVLKLLWQSPEFPGFDGEFVTIPRLRLFPSPAQQPHPPILIGGNSQASVARIVAGANGWVGLHLEISEVREFVDSVASAMAAAGRSMGDISLKVGMRSHGSSNNWQEDAEYVLACQELGIDQIIVSPSFSPAEYRAQLPAFAQALINAST
jgi:probable F420-dependent oxidoreductase